ncbi:MAG: hypothetical protein NTX45_30005 [Proteobacteria bacterium]|nr:hypothetical protein [Pseudomonadota bacterium]
MTYKTTIDIANPSNKKRSGYAQVNLESLGIPEELILQAKKQLLETKTTNDFGLSLKDAKGDQVPYQIDHVFGSDLSHKGVLVIQCDNVDGMENNDAYKNTSVSYTLTDDASSTLKQPDDLLIKWYYRPQQPSEPYSLEPLTGKPLYGIKLCNGAIKLYFSLKNKLDPNSTIDYTGSVTSINYHQHEGDLTSPFGDIDRKPPWARWGQVEKIALFPTPWDVTWFTEFTLWGHEYELVYRKDGPVRSVASFRAGPFLMNYNGEPFFNEGIKPVECYLYRILYAFPNQPFYFEQLVVLSKDGHSLSFRPYFLSAMPSLRQEHSSFNRFEHVPDYFAVWKTWASLDIGYGFTSDSHIRGINIEGNDTRWRLQNSHMKTCIHSFSIMNGKIEGRTERLKFIGEEWYEHIFKPLRPTPLSWTFNIIPVDG